MVDGRELAAIFVGGFLGAVARAELAEALPYHVGHWPWTTFIVNVAGAFLAGYFTAEADGLFRRAGPERRAPASPPADQGATRRWASGATSLRGIWGYHGEHRPHGDAFWQLRRRVPIVTVTVDTPGRIRRWFELIDELTHETGLVTSEIVPAFRATGPQLMRGGLALAHLVSTGDGPA